MDFSEMLHKANLYRLEMLIMCMGDSNEDPEYVPYSERLAEADKKADAFFKARFPELEEYNEIMAYYDDQVFVNRQVYFEIGMIVGGKIAFDISKRMEELK